MRAFHSKAMQRLYLLLVLLLTPFVVRAQGPTPVAPPRIAANAYVLMDFNSRQFLVPAEFQPAHRAGVSDQADDGVCRVRRTEAENAQDPIRSFRSPCGHGKAGLAHVHRTELGPLLWTSSCAGMIVQSGNDACVALAEAIAGTEEGFAQMMNREAQRLGMKNTNFVELHGPAPPASLHHRVRPVAPGDRDPHRISRSITRCIRSRSIATTTSRSRTATGCSGSIRRSMA